MSVYYWEDGPRTRFDKAVKAIKGDSSIDTLQLGAYDNGVMLEGFFALEQLEVIVKAMRKYEKEIAEAKAHISAQREA